MENNKPIQKFKAGAVEVSVWANEQQTKDGEITVHSVKLERKYKDKNGKWNSSSSFGLNDCPKAILLLKEAYKFLAMHKEQEEQ